MTLRAAVGFDDVALDHPWKMFPAVPSGCQSALSIVVTTGISPCIARHPPPWDGSPI